ncbi:MAG: glycosyltransferase family 2 protein [Butyrivibrio sp.]|nr:glycosyltransferase family 2 protein [Butyrivibrio sp.]
MSMNEPKITVIIPVYNVSQYVEQCIKSVQSQTDKNFRIIIINDGSTDDSWSKITELLKNDPRVVFVSKANEGLGPTRNVGLKIAETEYITFLDSDDWWREDYIEKMMNGVRQNADIVLADLYFYDQGKEDVTIISSIRLNQGMVIPIKVDNLLSKSRNFACGKLFKKRLFEENHVLFPAHPYEDVSVVSFLTSCARELYSVGEPLLYYRRNREGSIRSDLSTLKYIAVSVNEIYARFITSGRFEIYKKQLRQLFWGQYCFVQKWCRKYGEQVSKEELERYRRDIENICFFVFPELKEFAKGMFYIDSDSQVIMKSLRCLLIDEASIVSTKDEATCILSDKSGIEKIAGGINYMNVNTDLYEGEKEETVLWNLAEDIMDSFFEKYATHKG